MCPTLATPLLRSYSLFSLCNSPIFSLQVKEAGWTPKYDIRVDNVSLTLSVFYFGMIKQSTGEDWMNVKIILSTAAANVSGEIPELDTKYINLSMLQSRPDYSQQKKSRRRSHSQKARSSLVRCYF